MAKSTRKTVFVGMSGGVDSSVAAHLLKKQGHDVVGVFMRCYNIDGCAEKDAEDARRVAERIGIPFYAWDFEEEYKRAVMDYMIEGYRKGETPNPDVVCNREIKFGLFYERARSLGADYVATGHYVRLEKNGLREAKDRNKDQSYFLWTLKKEQLKHCLFPIGGLLKPEVREIARKAGLPTAAKKDSQGICFLGNVTISDFLAEYLPEEKGAVVTPHGEVIGEHKGAHLYTIGQREGVFQGGARKQIRGEDAEPLYVAAKDVRTNVLVVAGKEDASLRKKKLRLRDVNWIGPNPRDSGLQVVARVRYRQPLAPATLRKTGAKSCVLEFEDPQLFVAEGQSVVWYSVPGSDSPAGRQMLGGGVIGTAS